MNPVFVHDPRRGKTLHEWFSLDGNPDPEDLEQHLARVPRCRRRVAVDDDGADAGALRARRDPLKKQFSKLNGNEVGLMPIEEFVDLPESQRVGKTPFIYSADSKQRLIRLRLGFVVALVEERRKYWHLLQYLAGQHVSKMSASTRPASPRSRRRCRTA